MNTYSESCVTQSFIPTPQTAISLGWLLRVKPEAQHKCAESGMSQILLNQCLALNPCFALLPILFLYLQRIVSYFGYYFLSGGFQGSDRLRLIARKADCIVGGHET